MKTGRAPTQVEPGALHHSAMVALRESGFIVVEGTRGPERDRQTAAALCESFCRAWREDYFQDCLRKKDTEITADDVERLWKVLMDAA